MDGQSFGKKNETVRIWLEFKSVYWDIIGENEIKINV